MDKHMNLEETVQYLLDCIETGIRIEYYFTDRAILETQLYASNVGKYYLLKEGTNPVELYTIVKEAKPWGDEEITLVPLGEWPKPGAQGVPGQMGAAPEISISKTGTWVINGIDTGKPSRGVQGEIGHTGIQGLPGAGVGTLNDIDGTDYQPDVTQGEDFDLITTAVKVKYIMEDAPAEQVATLKYYVPHKAMEDIITIVDGEARFLDPVRAPNVTVPAFTRIVDGSGNTLEGQFAKKSQLSDYLKVPSQKFTAQRLVAYKQTDTSGSVQTDPIKFGTGLESYIIVERHENQQISVPTEPSKSNDATSKAYVDNAVASKLDAPQNSGLVYKAPSGIVSAVTVSINADADTIPKRGVLGTLKAADPVLAEDLVTKGYADDHYSGGGGGGGTSLYKHDIRFNAGEIKVTLVMTTAAPYDIHSESNLFNFWLMSLRSFVDNSGNIGMFQAYKTTADSYIFSICQASGTANMRTISLGTASFLSDTVTPL